MNNNWQELIFKLFIPLIFFAIWGVTHLFNRESKGFAPRPTGTGTTTGVRPGDPTLRWGPTNPSAPPSSRRVAIGDDDILIIPNDPSRPARPASLRSSPTTPRRAVKSRSVPAAPKKAEPGLTRSKMSGVSQNVNQQLARPIDLTPLTTIAPMANSTGSDLANAPSAPSKTSAVLTVSTLIPLMNDPIRLREAFIVNELLRPPLALRDRRSFHR